MKLLFMFKTAIWEFFC